MGERPSTIPNYPPSLRSLVAPRPPPPPCPKAVQGRADRARKTRDIEKTGETTDIHFTEAFTKTIERGFTRIPFHRSVHLFHRNAGSRGSCSLFGCAALVASSCECALAGRWPIGRDDLASSWNERAAAAAAAAAGYRVCWI